MISKNKLWLSLHISVEAKPRNKTNELVEMLEDSMMTLEGYGDMCLRFSREGYVREEISQINAILRAIGMKAFSYKLNDKE